MTLEELALLNELFSSRFGLHFPEHKVEILASRLAPRLRANHLNRFLDYYLLLQYDFHSEQDDLIRCITNNESYFFRETTQIEALFAGAADALRESGEHPGELRMLSAGCAAGEEPYTLRIFDRMHSFGRKHEASRIDAIDLDPTRLEVARQAIYRPSALRVLSDDRIGRYFRHQGDERYELRTPYREGIRFGRGNLIDLGSLGSRHSYDVIFCRNVLIYFSEPALKKVIDNFATLVRPGGLLFLGHSESIIGLTQAFRAERLDQCIAYRRLENP